MIGQLLRALVPLSEPLGFVWLCLLVVAAWLWVRRRRRLALFLFLLAAFLSVVGSTRLPGDLVATLERPFVIESLDAVPTADAVVTLGGAARPSKYEAFGLDLREGADRLIMALELARRGKAANLVLGGAMYTVNGRTLIEADLAKKWLETWGLTNAPIYSLGGCANTHDEALRVAALLNHHGWRRVILVTSAYHMKRAQATFRTAGVPVFCVPCDFQTEVSVETGDSLTLIPIPRPGGFQKTSLFLHEHIGWLTYRLRGWIKPAAIPPAPPNGS